MLLAAVLGHCSGNDVGPAQIHADDVLLALFAGHAQGDEVGRGDFVDSVCTAAATSRGVISRMQRQCPRGHRCGPCRSHGRQPSVVTPSTMDFGASGPNPNSGTVGPKIATVGVPMADARCSGEESFVTMARERE